MTHIIKITKLDDKWRLEDWKQRWVQTCSDQELDGGYGLMYGNTFPYSLVWHLAEVINEGGDNYFHATWKGDYWKVHGRCISPKRTW